MNHTESIRNILAHLGCITRDLNVRGNYPFKQFSLGRPHIDTLFLLSRESPLSIKELSKKLNVTSGAVTQFVDALENTGLVKKLGNPADKRSRLVHLTTMASQELNVFQKEYIESIGSLFEVLTPDELNELERLLEKVRNT